MKWYRVSFGFVLHEMSYSNLILYGAVIPRLDGKGRDGKAGTGDKGKDVAQANNPEDWQRIKDFYRHRNK